MTYFYYVAMTYAALFTSNSISSLLLLRLILIISLPPVEPHIIASFDALRRHGLLLIYFSPAPLHAPKADILLAIYHCHRLMRK